VPNERAHPRAAGSASEAFQLNPSVLRQQCVDAAQAAAELLIGLRDRGEVGVTSTKSTPTDIVTNADAAAEALLRKLLLTSRPDDSWLGEETGSTDSNSGAQGVRWVVDPIDGTVNYLYGLPGWAISVAAEVAGTVVAGAVVVPTTAEVFSAHLGGGATVDDRPLAVTRCAELSQALIATGFSYDATVRGPQGRAVAELLPRVRDIRRFGAAAVDLCSLAAGRVDAYYERGLQPWDRAAGALIAREAGGIVVEDSAGGVVAAGPDLIADFRALLLDLGGIGG